MVRARHRVMASSSDCAATFATNEGHFADRGYWEGGLSL
jgi:hypothetical protein